ncbi:MAG: PKD domain-containing protein [Chitinophagaceae bacterium]|nr:PKD domain-containing protein [Chitinophagaceae bacterium]
MKKIISLSSILLIALSSILVQCKKNNLELNGTASTADFSFAIIPLQDTLPFAYMVSFTNGTEEGLQYQWDFGDNTALSSEKNPKHLYSVGGEYIVKLTSVGTNGNNTISKRIFVIDACQNDFYSKLTGCNNFVWTWSTDADAIRVLSADGTQLLFAGAAAGCQADDLYKFNASGKFEYDANGQTFDAQAGFSCQAPKANAQKFKVVSKPGQLPEIILDSAVGGGLKPFIGTTDVVDSNKYTVVAYTATTMTLRGRIAGTGGQRLEIKLKKVVTLTLADINNILNGGSSKTWRLDDAPGANAIIVGTEANPSQHFPGGALDPCQIDDRYTFSVGNLISYNANGSTFNGGNIAPNYNCGSDRSYSNSYVFGPVSGGVAGIASLQLPSSPPNIFIGTTDVPSENLYRVIEISPTKLVLRAGNGSGNVFQFKFIPQ